MSPTSIIGRIISGWHVENAVEETLRLWMPTYLREIERQTGRAGGVMPNPSTYSHHNEFVNWPEETLPCIIIISPGQPEDLLKRDGKFDGVWAVGVGVVVSANDRGATRELSKLYIAAARAALLQHPSLGGFSRGLTPGREAYDDLPSDETRTLGAAQFVLTVEVENVTDPAGAPLAPAPDAGTPPPGAWPTVLTVDVDIEREGV